MEKLNTIEKIHIEKVSRQNLHLNKETVANNPIFEPIITQNLKKKKKNAET
jgi:hypothetical protein